MINAELMPLEYPEFVAGSWSVLIGPAMTKVAQLLHGLYLGYD